MAVGAYAMAILVVKADWSFWLAMPAAMVIAMAFGLLVGLPSLRLRADYFAIATIAAAEIVRLTAQNARGLTGGNQGLFCEGRDCYDDTWRDLSGTIEGWLESLGWSNPETLFPLLIVVWVTAAIVTLGALFRHPLALGPRAARDPRGRGRRARARQEHARLQAPVARDLGGDRGAWPASSWRSTWPRSIRPASSRSSRSSASRCSCSAGSPTTGASRSARSSCGRCSRALGSSTCRSATSSMAAVRFMIVGLVLILLMAFRPQGIFGNKREMVLGE